MLSVFSLASISLCGLIPVQYDSTFNWPLFIWKGLTDNTFINYIRMNWCLWGNLLCRVQVKVSVSTSKFPRRTLHSRYKFRWSWLCCMATAVIFFFKRQDTVCVDHVRKKQDAYKKGVMLGASWYTLNVSNYPSSRHGNDNNNCETPEESCNTTWVHIWEVWHVTQNVSFIC